MPKFTIHAVIEYPRLPEGYTVQDLKIHIKGLLQADEHLLNAEITKVHEWNHGQVPLPPSK